MFGYLDNLLAHHESYRNSEEFKRVFYQFKQAFPNWPDAYQFMEYFFDDPDYHVWIEEVIESYPKEKKESSNQIIETEDDNSEYYFTRKYSNSFQSMNTLVAAFHNLQESENKKRIFFSKTRASIAIHGFISALLETISSLENDGLINANSTAAIRFQKLISFFEKYKSYTPDRLYNYALLDLWFVGMPEKVISLIDSQYEPFIKRGEFSSRDIRF